MLEQVITSVKWIAHLWAFLHFWKLKSVLVSDWGVYLQNSQISRSVIFFNRFCSGSLQWRVHLQLALNHSGRISEVNFSFWRIPMNATSRSFLLWMARSFPDIKRFSLWIPRLFFRPYMIVSIKIRIVHFRNLKLFFSVQWRQVLAYFSEFWIEQNRVSYVMFNLLVLVADLDGNLIFFDR